MKQPEENPWTITSSQNIYDNTWINVTEYQVINPSGGTGIYGQVHFKNLAIGIIVLDEKDNTWLVGQYRFTLDAYSWEIPEGGGPLGTDPLDAAKRELLEETGITAQKWEEIQRIHLSNSVCNEFGVVFLARELSFGKAEPEDTEQLQLRKMPFEDAYQMVTDGLITDSLSIAAIFKIKLLKLEGKL